MPSDQGFLHLLVQPDRLHFALFLARSFFDIWYNEESYIARKMI